MPTLTLFDATLTGLRLGKGIELSLDNLAETVTVRELIRSRVYQEVDDHNRRVRAGDDLAQPFSGLVTPTAVERQLNRPQVGGRPVPAKEIDWRQQFDSACEAFEGNRFLILVDDRQVEEIDEPITLRANAEVAFVKLTMLVGG